MLSTKRLNTPLMGMEKWALITGSTGGIGKCFACELASRGWNLVLIDQHAHLLEPLQTGMGRMYPVKIIHHAFDLTSFEARARFWSWLEEQVCGWIC
jgi:short-subunit dehydrogenase